METLQEIKNQYAQEQGYEDWEDLVGQSSDYVDDHWTEICIRAQKAALEKQKNEFISAIKERADSLHKHSLTKKGEEKIPYKSAVTSFSIFKRHMQALSTNPENLIR